MMAAFWPTPAAAQMLPDVAHGMNARAKIVFSQTLRHASWNTTTDLCVLGSGQFVSQLGQAGLVDEYQFIIVPVVLGSGRTLFETVNEPLSLRLTHTRNFRNGNLFLSYEGARNAAADHSVHLV
jgi:dihydrofolate reductase